LEDEVLVSGRQRSPLLKAVVQAIPTYNMSMFLLPKSLCKEINSIMQRFWWGHKENDKKIHWMSWDKLGRSKAQGGLGFRDLVCFNKALLAKQGWRIIQNPDGLVASILKAKYFPHGSFLEAKEGNRPSLAWRSIISANNLLKDRLLWRIGDGRSVKIWGDRWLPRPSSFQIQSPCREWDINAKVNCLIDESTASWNTALVRDLFNAEDADLICNLAISKYGQKDVLFWRGTSDGNFSVRSAYFMELNRKQKEHGEASSPPKIDHFWRDIWQLKVTNPTKTFIWRACSNILPTKVNLARKGVVQDDQCAICCREAESTFHVLWSCPAAKDVWGACGPKIQKMNSSYSDFKAVFTEIMGRCNTEETELCAVIAKGIWTRQNGVVFGEDLIHPDVLIREASNSLQQFRLTKEYKDLESNLERRMENEKWKSPPTGMYKVNWDIAIDANMKRMGLGIIIRDEKRRVAAALSKTLESFQEPTFGEAMGARGAIEFSRELGFSEIVLEGDSKQVIAALLSKERSWCKFGHIIGDTLVVLQSFKRWEAGHARRTVNGAAHGLAKAAIKDPGDRIWIKEIPSIIYDIVTIEQIALSI
jgi:ribonuclease HI